MDKCRLCYSHTDPALSQNIFNKKLDPPIWKIIADLANITIRKDDPYTKIVCVQCLIELKKFNTFRQMILTTDRRIRHVKNVVEVNSDESIFYDEAKRIVQHHLKTILESTRIINDNNQISTKGTKQIKTEGCSTDSDIEKNDNANSTANLDNIPKEEPIEVDEDVKEIEDENAIDSDGEVSMSGNQTEPSPVQEFPVYTNTTFNETNLEMNILENCTDNTTEEYQDDCEENHDTINNQNIANSIQELSNDSNGIENNKMINSTSIKKVYMCDICNKSVLTKTNLSYHLMTHTGLKAFVCKVCNKRFLRNDALLLHMRIHTGEKRFHCHLCEKRFLRKVQLVKHLETHTEQNPNDSNNTEHDREHYNNDMCVDEIDESCHSTDNNDNLNESIRKADNRIIDEQNGVSTNNMEDEKRSGDNPPETGDFLKEKSIKTEQDSFIILNCGHMYFKGHSTEQNQESLITNKKYHCEICGEQFACMHYLEDHQKIHTK